MLNNHGRAAGLRLPRAGIAALLSMAVLAGEVSGQQGRLSVQLVTDEADAVLAILARRAAGGEPGEAEWRRLFESEGYQRLKRRETSLQRPFDDSSFRSFVLAPALLARRSALATALAQWSAVDLGKAAARAFAYLPANATIRVKVYPSIKPRENTFVFETRTDPAIFFYLDPSITPAAFENTLVHEFHHIGHSSACPEPVAPPDAAGRHRQSARSWAGGFAEGRAVLAAAGSPAVHPHATSDAAERAVWDRDVAYLERDLHRLEAFFSAVAAGRLSDEEQTRQGMAFVNTDSVPQGPFYTVGYVMARTVEQELGRSRLVASTCDALEFLKDYNRAAGAQNRTVAMALPLWSENLLQLLAGPQQ